VQGELEAGTPGARPVEHLFHHVQRIRRWDRGDRPGGYRGDAGEDPAAVGREPRPGRRERRIAQDAARDRLTVHMGRDEVGRAGGDDHRYGHPDRVRGPQQPSLGPDDHPAASAGPLPLEHQPVDGAVDLDLQAQVSRDAPADNGRTVTGSARSPPSASARTGSSSSIPLSTGVTPTGPSPDP
jgi:hypothetical protein